MIMVTGLLARMSVSRRLMLFIPVLLVSVNVVAMFGLAQLRQSLINDREEAVKNIVAVARGVVETWYDKEKSQQLTREQAQLAAKEQLRNLRYDVNNDYIFIQGYDNKTILNPNRPELEGEDRANSTDPDGVPVFKLEIEAAKAGGGFVRYRFPRGSSDAALPKISYVAGFDAWGWAIGSGIYIDDVDAIYANNLIVYFVVGALTLLIGVAIAIAIGHSIRGPLTEVTKRMSLLADGNLDVDVPFLGAPHEIGRLARALQVFKLSRRKADELTTAQQAEQAAKLRRQERLERLIADFHQRTARVIETVATAAAQVQAHARSLAEMANHSRSNISAVSHAAVETTGNVQAVAGAAEELSAAVGDVNQRVVKSTGIAQRAVSETERTTSTMRGLVDAAKRIGTIVQVIQDIASQTNLLALNATIEAARAGDAGKGFAVVASEVKTLASQTTKATEEIEAQVGAIQNETERAVEAIANIANTVDEMSEITTAIASAMEEQGSTTQEIARNIGHVADSTKEVSANITGVSTAAETTSHAANDLQHASEALLGQAKVLETEMKGFLGEMRAA
jgi:methyl-accepting chemotaxis protein